MKPAGRQRRDRPLLRGAAAAHTDEAAMTSEGNTERIVVGVDGSPASAAAMAWAARYARAVGAAVRVVLAWHYPASAGQAPVGVAPPSVTAEVEQSRNEILDKAIATAFGEPPDVAVER